MKYVSLHHHTTYSYMDGFGLPESHVARAAELGMSALAHTEHGNVSSHVALEKAAHKHKIKPIYGLEAYTGPVNMREAKNIRKWHLTLLAMDDVGYRNLMRLVTRSWAEGFYQWPTITGPMLAEHNEGLICLSGCADSKVACDLLGGKGRDKGDVRDARETVRLFRDLFGDRFYLEVQQFPELARTRAINTAYAEGHRNLGVPLVATADVHYPHPDDNEMQKILHAAGRGTGTVAAAEAEWEYGVRLTHPTSDAEIVKRLVGTGISRRDALAAVSATNDIASRCSVELPKVERLRFPNESGLTSLELIWEWLREGWLYRRKFNKLMDSKQGTYVDRVHYEMKLIEDKDFTDYFLMLSDAVRWCKDRGIPVGPARGSAAASLVCYLLRITEIDPMQFPIMMFERFIDVNRTDLPDVDLDFDDELRHELREHMVELYGDDRVANLGTFTKYRGKNSLVDVARVFGVPKWAEETVKDLMIERSGGDSRFDSSLEDTVEMFPAAQAVFNQYPDLWKACRLEGNYRGFSVHAAGLVIGNTPLTDNVAMYQREDKKTGEMRSVLSVDKYDAEHLGLLKADFLGLTTMGMIRRCLETIGMSLEELYALPLDDPEVIDAFRNNDVTGVFQFTGGATRIVNRDVKPDHFGELCDINALARPGPLHSGSTADYIGAKWKRKRPERFHEVVDEITKDTQYQLIYQEQILHLIRVIGNFPWTKHTEIRKIISLKKGEAAMNQLYDLFVEGAWDTYQIDKELATRIWRRIVTAGTYAFNCAHCVSYSMLAYWTMWLKVKHPLAFYASSLRKNPDSEYKLLRDALKHDFTIAPPDLNRSTGQWEVEHDGVRAGFEQVPGIALAMGTIILKDREENGPFEDWDDLQRVKGIGPSKMEKIKSFAESDDPFNVYRVERTLGPVREALAAGELGPLPMPTHRGDQIPSDQAKDIKVVYLGIPNFRNPQDVVEDERARTGEELDVIRARMIRPDLTKKMAVQCVDESDETVYLRFPRTKYNRQTGEHDPHFKKFERHLWKMRLGVDVLLIKGVRRRSGIGTPIHVDNLWLLEMED